MINAYLKETAIIMTPVINEYNQITSNNETTVKCRWETKQKLITKLTGEKVVSRAIMTIAVQAVSENNKVKKDNVIYAIIGTGKPKDFSERFMEVYLQ